MSVDRTVFEAKIKGLVGRTISSVSYWDSGQARGVPTEWDQQNWHLAVMGSGPVHGFGASLTPLCTNTFYPYGLETFFDPAADHARVNPVTCWTWTASDHPQWLSRTGPIIAASTCWEHLSIGPGTRSDGTVVSPAFDIDVPVSLRLDFETGDPLWFVAGTTNGCELDQVFIPGDEILVIFSPEQMREMHFEDKAFLG